MKKIAFSSHITALSAIFVLGGGVISSPFMGADEFNFLAYIISVVLLGLVYLAVSYLFDKIIARSCCVWICSFLLSAVGIFALFCGAKCFSEMTDFVSRIILPNIPKFFIVLIFGFTVIYFFLRQKESLLKFSLISIVLISAAVIFFFIAPMDKYDLRNIYIFRLPEFKEITLQIKPYIINPLLHSIILPIYFKLNFGETKTKQGFLGALIGCLLLGVCILSPILLFGADVSGDLAFPFSSAVSTVTVGRLFTRLDGFAYFVYFVGSLIKITVCVNVSVESLKKISILIDKS